MHAQRKPPVFRELSLGPGKKCVARSALQSSRPSPETDKLRQDCAPRRAANRSTRFLSAGDSSCRHAPWSLPRSARVNTRDAADSLPRQSCLDNTGLCPRCSRRRSSQSPQLPTRNYKATPRSGTRLSRLRRREAIEYSPNCTRCWHTPKERYSENIADPQHGQITASGIYTWKV